MRRRTSQAWVTGVAVAAACAAAAAPADGQAPATGGAVADFAPVVESIECRRACAGAVATSGSTLAMVGERLRGARSVTFLGRPGGGDDAVARPTRTSAGRVLVVVPADAVRGRAVVTGADGARSKPSPMVKLMAAAAPKDRGGPIATAITTRRAFFDGARQPTLTFELRTERPATTVVNVVRQADGSTVTSFDQGRVEPGRRRTVSWDGTVAGVPQPDGRYAFVVVAQDVVSGAKATSAQARSGSRSVDGFRLLGHRFPVRGKHDFGEFVASFGGGRGHKGQDVFAACGTPLVAARGGVVKMKRWQDRAGHYLVIDGKGTGVDQAYMHLREPALVDQRERVRTGQRIGYVGDTGRASGCHLHFEEWSAPGWYTGGSPFDPLPDLLAWDAVD